MTAKSVPLVIFRHGHSPWNLAGRFTGWADIPLDAAGIEQARHAGERLAAAGYIFDEVHVSVMQRSQQTMEALLGAMRHPRIPQVETWRLNERHYGQLQGMSKQEIFAAWGEQQSRRWWRGYYDAPPPLDPADPDHPRFDPRYAEVDPAILPGSESLRDCQRRLLPWWSENVAPRIAEGRRLLVISHGNTIRSLAMHLEGIAPEAIEQLEIPSGVPLVYRFDSEVHLVGREWLA